MTRIARALARATETLGASSDTPRLDAELLMSAALGIGRDKLLLDPPNLPAPDAFATWPIDPAVNLALCSAALRAWEPWLPARWRWRRRVKAFANFVVVDPGRHPSAPIRTLAS